MIKQMYPFICNNNKTLSYLELNHKRRIVIVLERFENRGKALEVYHRIFQDSAEACSVMRCAYINRARAQNFDGL